VHTLYVVPDFERVCVECRRQLAQQRERAQEQSMKKTKDDPLTFDEASAAPSSDAPIEAMAPDPPPTREDEQWDPKMGID
jgi:hypothetical protein